MTSVALIGPGAIGCVMAAALVDRPEIDLSIGARTGFERLVVLGGAADVDTAVRVLTVPPGADPVDVVLLVTKAYQTHEAQPWLDAWCGPSTVVAVLQNGVEHRERVQALVPSSLLVPVVVACPAERSAPGVAHLGGRAQLIVSDDARAAAVAAVFEDSFVEVIRTDDWKTAAWFKLLTNCAVGAVTTLTRRDNSVIADGEARSMVVALMHEVAAVARAEGADVPDDSIEPFLDSVVRRASGHLSSITTDRIAGRPTEWQVRNEVVVRRAAHHGIAVPLNAALTTLIRLGEPST